MHRLTISASCLVVAVLGGALFAACDDTVEAVKAPPTTDAGGDVRVDAPASDAPSDAPKVDSAIDLVARGNYIVNSLAGCGDCHTPRVLGQPDTTKFLAGVECFAGVDLNADAGAGDAGDAGGDAGDAGADASPPPPPGCLNTRNLTNHATGLANRSEQEIIDMFTKGLRPGGGFLHPFMPYWMYGNMTETDALAVVRYLRTVPGVDHLVPVSQPPWNNVQAAAPKIDLTTVPAPVAGAPPFESATRGRYLAAAISGCIDCHTPETVPGNGILDSSKWFAGSKVFPAALLGLPTPPFPDVIYSANLTSDGTGLAGYAAADIVKILKEGKDRDGGNVCPPMPVGPHGAYGSMTTEDATDIANYVLSLPPINLARPSNCIAP